MDAFFGIWDVELLDRAWIEYRQLAADIFFGGSLFCGLANRYNGTG